MQLESRAGRQLPAQRPALTVLKSKTLKCTSCLAGASACERSSSSSSSRRVLVDGLPLAGEGTQKERLLEQDRVGQKASWRALLSRRQQTSRQDAGFACRAPCQANAAIHVHVRVRYVYRECSLCHRLWAWAGFRRTAKRKARLGSVGRLSLAALACMRNI